MEMPEFSAIILWEVFFEKNKLIDKKMAELIVVQPSSIL